MAQQGKAFVTRLLDPKTDLWDQYGRAPAYAHVIHVTKNSKG